MDKALNYLGIMRKAHACAVGETDCGASCRGGQAKVLLLAQDASSNAVSRAKGFVHGRNIPLVVLPYEKFMLAGRLGKGSTSMIAVEDLGLAVAFMRALSASYEGYEEVTNRLIEKQVIATKRKAEKEAHERNKKFGKRRKKA